MTHCIVVHYLNGESAEVFVSDGERLDMRLDFPQHGVTVIFTIKAEIDGKVDVSHRTEYAAKSR